MRLLKMAVGQKSDTDGLLAYNVLRTANALRQSLPARPSAHGRSLPSELIARNHRASIRALLGAPQSTRAVFAARTLLHQALWRQGPARSVPVVLYPDHRS